MSVAKDDTFQPEWVKPENWPERRRAPGYPRCYVIPASVVWVIAILLLFWGFDKGPACLGWIGLGFYVVGHAIIYLLTLSRFRCPKCGKVVTLKDYPKPGGFFRFHCRDCSIIWLTGLQVSDDPKD